MTTPEVMTKSQVVHKEPLLAVHGVDVKYGHIQALFGVSLDVAPGGVCALIGPNGAGKTTLLRAVLGVVPASAGTISFSGEEITRLSVPKTVRRGLSLVPEGRELFAGLSVADNLSLGRAVAAKRSLSTEDLLTQVFDLFPVLGQRKEQMAGSLSGGEQQMAAIARALMGEPTLLLLDEPSLGLAPVMVERVVSGIARITEEMGMSVLMVEQNIGAAAALADQMFVMNAGRVVSTLTASGIDGFNIAELTARYWGKGPG